MLNRNLAHKINIRLIAILFIALLLPSMAAATPGEYAFHAKIGPSFEIQDSDNSLKLGGEFDYELGFGFGFNLSSHFAFRSDFLFQLIPAIKYDVLYFIPGTLFLIGGAGYELYDFDQQALGMRFGTGMRLPLKKPYEFITDINFFVTPNGLPGTPVTFDWLTGFGVRF